MKFESIHNEKRIYHSVLLAAFFYDLSLHGYRKNDKSTFVALVQSTPKSSFIALIEKKARAPFNRPDSSSSPSPLDK